MKNAQFRTYVAIIALNLMNFVQVAEAATITLATSPLADSTTSVVRPNILYILDNSGSMDWDYLPDYVSSGSGGTGSRICWNGTNDSSSLSTCNGGSTTGPLISSDMTGSSVQAPITTSDINYVYYNPAINYKTPFKADGSQYANSNPSSAKTDGYSGAGSTNLATTVTKTGTASAGTTSVTLSGTSGLSVGMRVTGSGIAAKTFLTSTSSPVTLSRPTTAALAGTALSFTSGTYPHQVYCSSSLSSTSTIATLQQYAAGAESSFAAVSGPSTTNGTKSVTGVNTANLYVGMVVTGTGIAANTSIAAITSSTALSLNNNASSGTPTLTFTPACAETIDTTSSSLELYPSFTYNSANSIGRAPYYYTMSPAMYCTDSEFANCQSFADATHTVAAKYRWCSEYNSSDQTFGTLTASSSCQDLRDAAHTVPDYLGGISPTTGNIQAAASLSIISYIPGKSITGLTVNGTNVIGGSTFTAGSGGLNSASLIASAICTAIQANSAASTYSCPSAPAGSTLVIKANIPPAHLDYATPNGYAVVVTSGAAVTPGAPASGTITINSTAGATIIQDITIGGVSVLTAKPQNFADGTATSAIATTLAGLIGNGFTATAAGSVITITSNTTGTAIGDAIAVVSTPVAAVRASAAFDLTSASSTSRSITVKAGTNSSCTTGAVTLNTTNTSTSTAGPCGSNRDRAINTLDAMFNGGTSTATANWNDSYSGAGCSDTSITYWAPSTAPTTYNGYFFCVTFNNTGGLSWSKDAKFTGAVNGVAPQPTITSGTMTATPNPTGPIATNATAPATLALSGGTEAHGNQRANVGKFKRVDIVPSVNSYPATGSKNVARTDCAGTTCTYAEELQNFANWYSYYRSRMLLMKTTSTLAFNELDSKYRVGFDLLSHYGSGDVDVPVAQFVNSGGETANQRTTWWNKLTSTGTSGSTPLRSSLMKAGRYYAGKLNSDPLQYSCQQNFTLLVTDGYWNSDSYGDINKIDTSADIGDQDNVNSGASLRPSFDGAVAPTCSNSNYSSCSTLADIAMYYYVTDLRKAAFNNKTSALTGLDVSANNVFKSTTDTNQSQHMTLFTMGLGAPGTLRYRSDYLTASTGTYADITSGPANWPAVKENDPTTIDDLWHAAVNGRGKYFSARDPNSVVAGLADALSSVQVREGAAAAAAVSNLVPTPGDNFAYVPSYTPKYWSGDLQARSIDLITGKVSKPANDPPNECVADTGCLWSAEKKLDALDWTTRKVYMAPTSGSYGVAPRAFTFNNLTATEQTYFDPSAGVSGYGTGPLSQYASAYAADPTNTTASKMVDFLRGDISFEAGNTSGNAEIWRDRAHVLGDIVNTQPAYVKNPTATYQDSGYSTFLAAQASREGVVYVSANDGMLHAFASDDFLDGSVSGGSELWSFIPTETLPYLRYLADQDYNHRYYVDGLVSVGDVNFGGGVNDWHTILVGGLGGGGKSYFALDVTDPLNPIYLWEFSHANLGYTYGDISINKLPNGEWAVLFSSGYNNADGKGYLYAVNPQTGVLKTGYPLSNNSGSVASPSNLGKVAAWVDNVLANNTATDIYAGDMDGDVWRFDLTNQEVSKLAHLEDDSNNAQPITTKPELTSIDGIRVVYVGTGRYLGETDPADQSVQSFYAIKDDLGGLGQPTWNPRTDGFIQRKIIALKDDGSQITRLDTNGIPVEARQICTGINSAVSSSTGECVNESGGVMDWATVGGWYFDLPDLGERMNVDMNLTLGTLIIPTNVPVSSSCTTGGYGWLNYIDFKTGLQVDSTLIVSQKISNALIVGLNVIKIGDKLIAIVTTSDFSHNEAEPPGSPSKFKGRRDLWRELDIYQ